MRVTNGMLINTTLNGLYKGATDLNKTYAQMTSGKKIQTVSDDPIIAGRALKLKTTVLETTQYQTNVKEANAWLEVTGGALTNVTEILKQIRTKCNQGANGTLEAKDKKDIQTEVLELLKQLQEEANVTYGGRYVFSGYKTSEPLILTKNETLDAAYTVADNMAIAEGTKVAADSKILNGSTYVRGSVLGIGTEIPKGSTLTAGTVLSKEDAVALGYTVSGTTYTTDGAHTIPKETQITNDMYAELQRKGVDVSKLVANNEGTGYYVAEAGDLVVEEGKTLSKDTAEALLGVKVSGDSYTITQDKTLGAAYTVLNKVTLGSNCKLNGDVVLKGESSLAAGSTLKAGSTMAAGTVLAKGSLNPKVHGKIDGQQMNYQIGVNSSLAINTLGMDSIFSDMIGCLNSIYADVTASINGEMSNEQLSKNFSKQLEKIDAILADVSDRTSELGSKVSRASYVTTRLTDQKTTYKNLLTETEDVDIEEVYTQFNVQYATYQSALQAASKVLTNTLADYL